MKEQWIKDAKAGDEKAWSILYQRHYPWLYAISLQKCGDNNTAKDIAQDVFVQAYLKLHQLKDPAAFAGWLKTMLLRACYHAQKKFLDDRTHLVPVENEKYWEENFNNKMEICSRQTKLYNTISCLPESLQTVLLLRYFSEWRSYEQMATILCVPIGTIRSRLNQAKLKLVERWQKSNEDEENAFHEANSWNHFYNNYFTTVHFSLSSREKFINHLDKNMQLVFTSGKIAYGRNLIAKEIENDLLHGSSFSNVQVSSSGNISIVEVCNRNSKEHPDRCPESGVFVLYRDKNKISKLNFHNLH